MEIKGLFATYEDKDVLYKEQFAEYILISY